MTKSRSPLEILDSVLGAISRGGYASLARSHGLEQTLAGAAQRGLEEAPAAAESFSEILKLAQGLDTQPLAARRNRLERMQTIVERLRSPAMFEVSRPAARPVAKPANAPAHPAPRKSPAAKRASSGSGPGLKDEVKWVKGVGPKLADVLERLDIHTVEDLLFHLPVRYDDLRHVTPIRDLVPGMQAVVVGEVTRMGRFGRNGRELIVRDSTGELTCKWFQGFERVRAARAKPGDQVRVTGDCRQFRSQREFHHPDIEFAEEPSHVPGGIIPVYPLTEGLHPKQLRTVMANALQLGVEGLSDGLETVKGIALPPMPLGEAVRRLHQPPDDSDIEKYLVRLSEAHERLRVHEAFFLALGLAIRRRQTAEVTGISIPDNDTLLAPFINNLPFELTGAQKRAVAEIRRDLVQPRPMNRLLQGDVGAGKTVVALAAALVAVGAGYQAALMAPTEILAEQHFQTMTKLVQGLEVPVALLTGSQKLSTESLVPARVYHELARGTPMIAVGTHALIQEKVTIGKLAFVIIDEQHRFGVEQRRTLLSKGYMPDVLVMTATPIPRTLALTVYGDLEISTLDELPPGRRPVQTVIAGDGSEMKLWDAVARQLAQGRQAYVVYPLVSESELIDLKDAERGVKEIASHYIPGARVGLLHGKMKPAGKDKALGDFRAGRTQVLVSTTVIEVGIDVPNATVMVIEHAERFGLAQIHQLRGRVGRGGSQSYCFLVPSAGISAEARRRLQVLASTNDGFRIAEADLEIRGPGEFLGTRQSGLPEFRVLNLARDLDLLQSCREAAAHLLKADPGLQKRENGRIRTLLLERWKGKIEFSGVA